ncbi:MAG TPA: hypothetical protein VJO35_14950 [Terriglobales bacterium]|nr:hypothetical protein [Terriglobales bacterium]
MTTWNSSSDSPLFVRRIKEEIKRLTCEQDDALKAAASQVMTQEQQELLHSRRRRIKELLEHLTIFENTE